ncbi:TPA: hypothetical protein ACP3Y2_004414 [Pseudomonas aeruginosa]
MSAYIGFWFHCSPNPESETLPVTPKMIGIDLGLKDLFVTSEGERIGNPLPSGRGAVNLA